MDVVSQFGRLLSRPGQEMRIVRYQWQKPARVGPFVREWRLTMVNADVVFELLNDEFAHKDRT